MPFKRPTRSQTLQAIGSVVGDPDAAAYTPNTGFRPLPAKPRPGAWLSEHREDGQSYQSFARRSFRCSPHGHCNTMYIVPIGSFEGSNRCPPLDALVEYTGAYFGCRVSLLKRHIPIESLADNARVGDEGQLQLECSEIRRYLTRMKLPRDSFCVLAITMQDLFVIKSGEAWNFVFGQASLMDGVGVFSFARYDPAGVFSTDAAGDFVAHGLPELSPAEIQLVLRRCCRVLTHEGSHVLGLKHCIHFECLMNGSNHLQESDAAPLHLCPLCLRKLKEGAGFDVTGRYHRLLKWYEEHSFPEDAAWIQQQLEFTCMPCAEQLHADEKNAQAQTCLDTVTSAKQRVRRRSNHVEANATNGCPMR